MILYGAYNKKNCKQIVVIHKCCDYDNFMLLAHVAYNL